VCHEPLADSWPPIAWAARINEQLIHAPLIDDVWQLHQRMSEIDDFRKFRAKQI
jgi:hypothetical protein